SLIDHFDTSAYATKFAGLVKDFNCDDFISRKEQRKMDAFIQYGIVAGIQAMQDSGLEVTEENATRIGAAIGSGIGGLGLIEENHSSLVKGGPRKISPFFVPSTIVNMVAGHLTIMFGLRGPSISIATACTSGVHNIGHAARVIAYGDADAMVAGGAEKASTPLGVGGFGAARALSTRNDNPQAASRPWDKERDGFVLGDGALRLWTEALLILTMAQMWNLLAGYAGLVSFGHQVFVAAGAYALFLAAEALNVSPYWVLPLAPLAAAFLAALVALPLFRLRDAYFSIGIWVFSEIVATLVTKSSLTGATAGLPLKTSSLMDLDWFEPTLFWIASVQALAATAGLLLLMRSEFGL
ncbi:MAG: beta-ketoacyl synthase N-terminal-like domain-containing protein, partial [Klebsiella sp.]|nr:beta-ketoacyl synthase N-terminal-like domain-containing protein [Klebsiella sp.]